MKRLNSTNATSCVMAAVIALSLGVGAAWAQSHDAGQPADQKAKAPVAKAEKRVGDPYPFDTCPISGKKLGSMGDPVVKQYDGREVRYCCGGCPGRFEKDSAASIATLDEKIAKDQRPLYPLKTSLVTGKDLPAKPYEFVYGNRLIVLGADSEKAEFLKDPKKYMGQLDKAVIDQQGKTYTLAECPASGEKLGAMGEAKDVVLAGRLVRLCCSSCKEDVEKDPAKFIAKVDAARGGAKDAGGKDKDTKGKK